MNTLVSIILPVFNGETTISDSIESLLSQTHKNFELIIINDGSSDDSLKIINQFKDIRIKVYSQNNSGLAKTLNYGIEIACGELIARQDQDDISFPTRIERQVQRFNENKKLVLLGTNSMVIDENDQLTDKTKFPTRNIDLQFLVNFYNPFIHTSVMMKAEDLKRIGGYSIDISNQPPEDFELWNRLKHEGELENLKDYLVLYRKSKSGMSNNYKNIIAVNYRKLVIQNMKNLFNLDDQYLGILFDLQFTNTKQINRITRIKLFLKFLVKVLKSWSKSKSVGVNSFYYTLRLLGKIVLK